jgi:ABC-type nitrate/sulfonate/bicarbonate transport system substrate-binding protein
MTLTRRDFLSKARMAASGLGLAAALAACGGNATPTTAISGGTVPGSGTPGLRTPGGATPGGATPGGANKPSRKFSLGYLTLGWAGIEITHKLDLLKQRGWNTEWQSVGPINGLINAYASMQVELIDMAMVLAAQMYENGVPLTIFGTAVATLGAIVVREESPIKTVADLKGRKVGGIPGSATAQDVNASLRKVHGFDLFTDTQFVQATAPADLIGLMQKRDVEAGFVWEPITSQLKVNAAYRVLASQQELWEQASGTKTNQVHVVYVTTPEIAREYRALLADVNQCQAEVADLWRKKDPKAVDAIMQVTQLPKDVVEMALGQTNPLSGLTDEHIQTILAQLKLNRENGTILKSDIWLDPAKVSPDIFFKL